MTNPLHCPRCETAVIPNAEYCHKCGWHLSERDAWQDPEAITGSIIIPAAGGTGAPDAHAAASGYQPAPHRERYALAAVVALLVFGGAVAAAVLLLRGGNGEKLSFMLPTATAQASAATATAPPATARPSATPVRSPTPKPTPRPPAAVVAGEGFTPQGDGVSVDDGSGGQLLAIKALCAGSADGHCQKVFFFVRGEYLGTDTAKTSLGIINVAAAGTAKINVTYANYAPSDPFCCPSLPPVTISYSWDGSTLTPSGVPPGHS